MGERGISRAKRANRARKPRATFQSDRRARRMESAIPAVTTAMPKYASRVAKKYMEKQPKTAVIQKRIQFRFFRDSCQAREMGTSTQRLEL